MFDIIIIGAGPAGLTSAIYGRRANKKVLVLEEKNFGGQIINTMDIENYPALYHISGFDFANNLYHQALKLGAEIKFEKVIKILNGKIKKVYTKNNIYEAKTIIVATGCVNKEIGLENEKALIGKGISYCATCDGAFYKNKTVCVVGGGNTAIEDALYLSSIVKEVFLIHRRNSFRADKKTIELLKEKENVHFIYDSVITKINGYDRLESIIINNDKEIKTDGLFIAIGKKPENSLLSFLKLDENGYVLSKENCHTNRKGIFVAGDVRRKDLRQLVTATSDGAIAANEAIKYLSIYEDDTLK